MGGLAKREGAGWGILGGQGWPEGARPAPTGEPQGCRDQPGCTRAVPDAAGHQLLGIPSSLVPATGTGWEAEPGGTPASPPSTDPPKRRNRPPLRAKSRSHQQWDPPNPAGPSPCQTGGHMGDPLPRAVSCSGMPRLGHLPKQPKIAWPPPPVTGGGPGLACVRHSLAVSAPSASTKFGSAALLHPPPDLARGDKGGIKARTTWGPLAQGCGRDGECGRGTPPGTGEGGTLGCGDTAGGTGGTPGCWVPLGLWEHPRELVSSWGTPGFWVPQRVWGRVLGSL